MGLTPPVSPSAGDGAARRAELSDFLRSRRALVRPEDAGLPPADGRRRTPGLRREEVAQLAGVGVSWYTWLEQGRDIHPSPQVLDALARALRLDPAERDHLFHLARVERPLTTAPYATEASPQLAAFVAALEPHPAWVINPRADVLAWNPAATRLFSRDFAAGPPDRRNQLWWLFTDDRIEADEGWRETARRALARFRAEHARRPGDPAFARLVTELSAASPQFAAWWPRHEVLTEQSGTKTIEHPRLGRLTLHHLQSAPTSDPDLRLAIYVPADEPTRRALAG